MKTIAIYVPSLKLGGPTFENEHRWQAYLDLLLKLNNHGVDAFFVTGSHSYLGAGRFTRGYIMFRPGHPEDLIEVPDITADLVFDRGGFTGTDVTVLNPPRVLKMGYDKTLMYQAFAKYQPFSVICRSRRELEAALARIETELVVVKDPTGMAGSGVYIGPRDTVLGQVRGHHYPLLAQEFIDTSVGIPGLVEGMHDLRVTVIGGEAVSCSIRQPKAGDYRANVALGGSVRYLPPAVIPLKVRRLVKEIDAYFDRQPRHYAVDFARTPQGWKLIELNSWPGLVRSSFSSSNAAIMRKLTHYLVKQVKHTGRVTAPVEAIVSAPTATSWRLQP